MIGICDVCNRDGREVHVCSSAFEPISQGNCMECLEHGAESILCVKSLLLVCGGTWDNISEDARAFTVFVDGEYRPATTITVTPQEYAEFWDEFQKACDRLPGELTSPEDFPEGPVAV